MPELPEVEVTKLGIEPYVVGQAVSHLIIYDGRLRWPVPSHLKTTLQGQLCQAIDRRGKYLLFQFGHGILIIHLGMTGVLRIQHRHEVPKKHDRVEIVFDEFALRLHDPRKFGAIWWHPRSQGPVEQLPMLARLGLEPLEPSFAGQLGGKHLHQVSRGRTIAIKQFLLAGHAVVGVGNIYCSESLFEARINPKTAAGKISEGRYMILAESIRKILQRAIAAGGSSLKDFVNSHGEPGHFMMQTKVYDRANLPCTICQRPIKQIKQTGRSTFYCATCQK